jgi:hypothetical protein
LQSSWLLSDRIGGDIVAALASEVDVAWQLLSRNAARRHPLYGFGGWLAFWSVVMILGLPFSLAMSGLGLSTAHPDGARALDKLVSWGSGAGDVLALAGMGTSVALVVLWFCRVKTFRVLWLSINFGSCAVGLSYIGVVGLCVDAGHPGALGPFVSAAIPAAIGPMIGYNVAAIPFIVYMFRSRRFRVTFEHRVAAEDAWIAASVHRSKSRLALRS